MKRAAFLCLVLTACSHEEATPAPVDTEAAAKAARIVTGKEPLPILTTTPAIPPEAIYTQK